MPRPRRPLPAAFAQQVRFGAGAIIIGKTPELVPSAIPGFHGCFLTVELHPMKVTGQIGGFCVESSFLILLLHTCQTDLCSLQVSFPALNHNSPFCDLCSLAVDT